MPQDIWGKLPHLDVSSIFVGYILIKMGSALVEVFIIKSNYGLFESCPIMELSILIWRNFL
jgi:hypothetical protein